MAAEPRRAGQSADVVVCRARARDCDVKHAAGPASGAHLRGRDHRPVRRAQEPPREHAVQDAGGWAACEVYKIENLRVHAKKDSL